MIHKIFPEGYPVEYLGSAFIFVFVYVLELLIYKKIGGPERHENKVNEAIARGNVVTAVFTGSTHYLVNAEKKNTSHEYYAGYEYEVNGRRYKKVKRFKSSPPEEITLYYLDDPGKSFMKQKPADIIPFLMLIFAFMVGIASALLFIK